MIESLPFCQLASPETVRQLTRPTCQEAEARSTSGKITGPGRWILGSVTGAALIAGGVLGLRARRSSGEADAPASVGFMRARLVTVAVHSFSTPAMSGHVYPRVLVAA